MAKDGDYPFIVNVSNRFDTGSGINLTVTFNHWPNGKNPFPDDPTSPPTNANPYEIMPGDCLGFHLYWVNESLTIKISNGASVQTPYYIFLGPKAKCTSVELVENGDTISFIPSGTSEYIAEVHNLEYPSDQYDSKSGVWTINDASLNWTIKIGKLSFDPETTNVSVGPDLP